MRRKDVIGVLFPFQRAGVKPLQKLGIGVGSSFARTEGAASLPSGNGFATEGQQQFFTYTSTNNTLVGGIFQLIEVGTFPVSSPLARGE